MVAPDKIPETNTPNPEGKDLPKNSTDTIDYNKVVNDVQEFYEKNKEFLQRKEKIEIDGTKDEKAEYYGIVKKIIDSYEPKVEELLKKMNINKVDIQNEQYKSMTDNQINEIADKKMLSQPEKFNKQKKLLKKINDNGSPEDINGLIEIVNNCKKETQNFWYKFNEKRNTNSNNSVESNYTAPGEHEAGSVPGTQLPEGEKTNPGGHTAPGPEREGSAVPETQPSNEEVDTNSVDYTAPGEHEAGPVLTTQSHTWEN